MVQDIDNDAVPESMWLAYLAMATAILPLVFMGVGYLMAGDRDKGGQR